MINLLADPNNPSQALLSALMDGFPDMIHSVDEQGNIVFFNTKALDLLGYSADELTGMNIRRLYAPEILEAVEKGFDEVKQTCEKRVESLFISRDGVRIPVELRTLSVRDENGAFMQTFTISRDIRKQKEVQDNLLRAGRLAAIGELASGVANDINNPMASVTLSTSLLQHLLDERVTMEEPIRNQANALMAMLKESAESLGKVADRLGGFSRGAKANYEPLDLFDPIREALFTLDHRLTITQVETSCQIMKAKHWVYGNRNQLTQVFLNLIANACDAMADSQARALTVDIAQEGRGGRYFWCCSIRDTGIGIKREDLDRVFKAFFTTKQDSAGAGLGLCIARSVISEHGGEITLESECGKGTAFCVMLPMYVQRTSFVKPAALP
jgi:PAS domain S-box-containing protein